MHTHAPLSGAGNIPIPKNASVDACYCKRMTYNLTCTHLDSVHVYDCACADAAGPVPCRPVQQARDF